MTCAVWSPMPVPRGSRCPGYGYGGLLPVEAAHVRRGKALELHAPESGRDVYLGDVGVVGICRLLYRAFY
jgi:hypothetical protein